METNKIFTISTLFVIGTIFGMLSMFYPPSTLIFWISSDIALGAGVYIIYLIIAMNYSLSQDENLNEFPGYC
ncbi:MAG: C4-dicarboxylate ABC transporter [Nitrosomonas sp.]|uniref:C4-dicarboxylate ABC transporter n=1 Tax=Nitrosomonas sp. TaxID=42353 RepID=UPI0025FFECBC|nr:C4-dicarboxylate ABC transporter [Nitrosomonas sp.]MBY0475351.1 C4-dicarboxylate ABC transporter [Nitrosomonas sp.]